MQPWPSGPQRPGPCLLMLLWQSMRSCNTPWLKPRSAVPVDADLSKTPVTAITLLLQSSLGHDRNGAGEKVGGSCRWGGGGWGGGGCWTFCTCMVSMPCIFSCCLGLLSGIGSLTSEVQMVGTLGSNRWAAHAEAFSTGFKLVSPCRMMALNLWAVDDS